MEFFNRHSAVRRSLALLLTVTLLSACGTWREVADREGYVTAKRPDYVQLQLSDGRTLGLQDPVVVGDRFLGYRRTAAGRSRVAVRARNVEAVERWTPSASRTTILVAAATVVGILFLAGNEARHASSVEVRVW